MPIGKEEEKMLNLRAQMQQNQTELQDYLQELDSWETDIRHKEQHLKELTTTSLKSQDLPPVRNTIQKKKMKKKRKSKSQEPQAPRRISGYDFSAWDKFDVDKALEEIDKQAEQTSSSEYETDEEWEVERRQHLAALEKDKGNEFLKQGDYEKAVEAYTKGMEFDCTNAVLPANRAMALLKQQKFAAAELDCTVSISLDPVYVKAYLRRATARVSLTKLGEAVQDYQRVLDLEPGNKLAKSEIDRLQKELKRETEGPVLSSLTETDRGHVKPIYKPPEERSKVLLKRIMIEEIGVEANSGQKQSGHPQKIAATDQDHFNQLFVSPFQSSNAFNVEEGSQISSASNVEEVGRHSSVSKVQEVTQNSSVSSVEEGSRISRSPPPRGSEISRQQEAASSCGAEARLSSNSAIPSNVLKSQKRPVWNNVAAPSSVADLGQSVTSAQSARLDPTSRMCSGISQAPQTSFQFQADFRLLRNQSEAFFQYFQAIAPADYPRLFGQCLDADMLVLILRTLASFSDRCCHDLYEVLHQLSQVKRFSMTILFLSQADKQVVKTLLEQLSSSDSRPKNDILSLMRAFGL